MSDEEKKAIQYLNKYCDTDLLYEQRHYNYIKMIIRLVGKQSKEIEELKEKNKELDEENTRQHELIGNIHKKWKDKIKAKIEEYEKEIQIRKNVTNSDVLDKQTIEKAMIEWACMEDFIYEMQSLLEKE